MKQSIAIVAAFAAVGMTACTTTPETVNTGAPVTSTTAPAQEAGVSVVTEVVTHAVTTPAPGPKLDAFGYGALKLAMSKQEALNTKMIGAGQPYADNLPHCSVHTLAGTDLKVVVSTRTGVSVIPFTTAMTTNGTGIGATSQAVQAAHPNLAGGGLPNQHRAAVSGNPNAHFKYQLRDGKVFYAGLVFSRQDCQE